MVRLRGGTYYTYLFGHLVVLFYMKNNRCRLYIDGTYRGEASFHYVRAEIHRLKQTGRPLYLYYRGENIWKEGRKGLFVHVRA